MTDSTVKLTLRADTSAFSTSIRQAKQEFSSCFRHVGNTPIYPEQFMISMPAIEAE